MISIDLLSDVQVYHNLDQREALWRNLKDYQFQYMVDAIMYKHGNIFFSFFKCTFFVVHLCIFALDVTRVDKGGLLTDVCDHLTIATRTPETCFISPRYTHTVYYSSSNDSVNPELHPQSHHNVIHVTDIKQKSRREDGVTVCTSSCLIFWTYNTQTIFFGPTIGFKNIVWMFNVLLCRS